MKHRIHMTTAQLKRIHDGYGVALKHEQLSGGAIEIELPEHHTRRIHSAIRRRKGIRLHMTPEEIEGSGIKKWFKKTWKKAKHAYKKHIKPHVAPIIKKGLTDLADLGIHALTEAAVAAEPELAPAAVIAGEYARKGAHKGIEWVGRETGAYGIRAVGRRRVGYYGH